MTSTRTTGPTMTTAIGGTYNLVVDADGPGLFADDAAGGRVIFDLTAAEARELAGQLLAGAELSDKIAGRGCPTCSCAASELDEITGAK